MKSVENVETDRICHRHSFTPVRFYMENAKNTDDTIASSVTMGSFLGLFRLSRSPKGQRTHTAHTLAPGPRGTADAEAQAASLSLCLIAAGLGERSSCWTICALALTEEQQ